MSTSLSKLCLLLALSLSISALPDLQAGFGNDAFEDDPALRQEDNLDWPEVEFPEPEIRGKGFKPGESFNYRARWGIFKKAGSMSFSTEALDNAEQPALLVQTKVASSGFIRKLYPLKMHASTVLDAINWRVLRNETESDERSKQRSHVTLFDYERMLMNYEDRLSSEYNHIRELPYDCPVDYASAFLQLRGLDLKVGGVYPVFVSTKNKFYYAQLKVKELETLDTEIGEVECFRLEPISSYPVSKVFREGGKMALWITNDERRIPVRLDVKAPVGTASIRLESYTLAE